MTQDKTINSQKVECPYVRTQNLNHDMILSNQILRQLRHISL